jgi:ribosomal protein S12 methylthiotransferase accessory factor YcaO
MLHKEDVVFNEEAALAALIEKYGQEATAAATSAAAVEKVEDADEKVEGDKKKRKPKAKKADDEEEELDEDGKKIKKQKAPDTVAVSSINYNSTIYICVIPFQHTFSFE